MATRDALVAHGLTRRTFLALSAAGTAAAALAACGGTTTAPTPTTAATRAASAAASPTTTGPAATATPIPQSLGTAATASSGSAVAPTVAASAATQPANAAAKVLFRYCDQEPADFDPGIAGTPWTTNQMFEGLITVSPKDGTFSPAMAESYQANADGTVWTFKIRPGVKWSDGTPLTAADFEYSWKRVMDPKTASKYTAALFSVKNGMEIAQGKMPPDQLGVKAVDPATFEVTLNAPTPFFPVLAATWTCFPVPRQVIEKAGNKWEEPQNIVVNGPYILKEWRHDQLMAFEVNPNYWGPKPTVTRVEYTLFTDPGGKGLPAYENGELDHALVPSSEYDRVRNDPKLSKEMKAYPASSTEMLHFDCANKPTSDVRVRQALGLAFDRDALINDVLKKYYLNAPTVLPADIPGNNPAAALTGGVDKAKQLLVDAGFPNGQGFPSDFTLVTRATSPSPIISQFLQQQWKQNLGISVTLQPLDEKTYVAWRSARTTQPFNVYMGTWGSDFGDPSNWHNQLFASNADFYHTHWKNDAYDSLVTKAKSMTDKDARVKAYADAEQMLMQDAANVPVYHGQNFYVTKPNIQNVYHFPTAAVGSWWSLISAAK